MRIREVITGFCIILIAGFLWILSRNIPFQGLKAGLGPAFFPYLSLAILTIFGITYLIVNLFIINFHKGEKVNNKFCWLTIVIFGLLIIYAILFKYFGFIISTLLFLACSMIILKVKWLYAILISALTASGLYLIFITFLKVPLP